MPTSLRRPTSPTHRSTSLVRAAAVVVPLLVCLALAQVRGSVPTASAALVLVLCVVAAAATGDRPAGLVAALSGGAWFDVFLTEPFGTLEIHDPHDVQAAVLLVLIGVSVTEIALWGRRQQEQASRRSGYLDGILSAASAVAAGEAGSGQVVDVVAAGIVDVLDADACRYQRGPVHDVRVVVLDRDGVLTRGGHAWDVERAGLPADEYVALEVRRSQRVVGHFLVSSATHVARPSREQCRVAVLLADQLAPLVDA